MVLLLLCAWPGSLRAHEIRPALLSIERDADVCTITWKQPLAGALTLPLSPELSTEWQAGGAASQVVTRNFRTRTWKRGGCAVDDVNRLKIRIAGLAESITNAVVTVDDGVNRPRQFVLSADADTIDLASVSDTGSGWFDTIRQGVLHILEGLDHLAFILALAFLCRTPRRIIIGLTGFTLGHSIALFIVALKMALPDPRVIEVLVGLSIALVAVEALDTRKERAGIAYRYPFLVSAGFGVVHGTAFSSALVSLSDTLSRNLATIAGFNIGIELGQLLFLAAFGVIAVIASRSLSRPDAVGRIALYIAGSYGMFLVFDRLALAA